eukprot:TRINITY_DN980_c0_g1_i2.p1 TRINITY_DN980_c0_g1~~TRINITY_DN980_c0_g1_i2.p1  ORF type:complete len:215 (+),score=30.55 TRINITY_DN980_c0_g1_i2:2366-3010(+)
MSLAVTGDDSYLESKREKRAKTERLYEHHEDHLSERVPVPLVALQPEATPAMCAYCFDVIACRLEGRTRPPLPPFTKGISCPFFVTWEKQGNGRAEDFKLRGCIGTLSPQPLTALADYACSSAFDDRRFSPIAQCELRHLKCSVSLLVDYEDAEVSRQLPLLHKVAVYAPHVDHVVMFSYTHWWCDGNAGARTAAFAQHDSKCCLPTQQCFCGQ